MANDLISMSFQQWITDELNNSRLENYKAYEGYYNGDEDTVTDTVPTKIREALESELGTQINFCKVIVDTPPEYISGGGRIGIICKHDGSKYDPTMDMTPDAEGNLSEEQLYNQSLMDGAPYPQAEATIYRLYEDNDFLFDEIINILTQMGTFGDAFIRLAVEDNIIKLYVDRPDQVFPKYADSSYKDMLWCAYKWFDRDPEQNRANLKAQVFLYDPADKKHKIQYYMLGDERETSGVNLFQTQRTTWNLVGEEENPLGFIPVIHIKNMCANNLEYGVSDLQPAISVQDAINKTVTDMLLVMDNQSFQRVFVFGGIGEQQLTLEPGKITEVPNESGHIQALPNENIAPFLQQIETLIDMISAVTSIPRLTYTRSYSIPFSGFALKIMTYPLDRKCVRKTIALENGLKHLNKMIFQAIYQITGGTGDPEKDSEEVIDLRDCKTEIKFNGGLPHDEITDTQVRMMELQARIKSKYTVREELGIENPMREQELINKEMWDDMMMQAQFNAFLMAQQPEEQKAEE